ncbi:MAG: fused MFS/spermidine synthase [Verrucomicrobia bacterium]|nr:fused MFS/spermidine synthase [Verrucomicrobiota bacterium]
MNSENERSVHNTLRDAFIPNVTVFIASACIMIVEIVAGRIISRFLGQSLYTWTSVIGIVLAGISIGNYIGGRLADRFEPHRTISTLFILSAAASLLIPWLNSAAGSWIFLLKQDWPVRIFVHVFITFILPSCALGTISPVVAKVAITHTKSTGRTIGNVYAWGAAGSILGTFLAGFFLIALMGTFAIITVVAGILVVMGLCYSLRALLPRLGVFLVLLVFWGTFGHSDSAQAFGRILKYRQIESREFIDLFDKESQYSRVVVKAKRAEPDYRVLALDRLWHSKVNIKDPLQLLSGYTWIFESLIEHHSGPKTPLSVFVIGGGGYTMPQYIELTRPGSRIYVAEIDPEVTEAAFAAFGLDGDTGIDIRNMDARNAVDDLLQAKARGEDLPLFDYILGDSINNKAIPFHLTTHEFNESLARLLSDDGLYLFHVIDSLKSGRFLGAVYDTVRETFPYVSVVSLDRDLYSRGTFMLVCSKRPHDVTAVPAMIKHRHSSYSGKLLTRADLDELDALSEGLVLTDDFAPVDNLIKELVKGDSGDLCQKYLGESDKAFRAGDIDKAVNYLNQILELEPRYEAAYSRLASCHEAAGRLDDAMTVLDEGLEINPQYTEYRVLKGELFLRRGEVDKAVAEWESVLQERPGNVDARNDLGIAWAYKGEVSKAVGAWERVLQIAANNSTAHYYLGKALFKLGDLEGASFHSKQASVLDPGLMQSARDILPKSESGVQQYMEKLLY